MDSFSDLTTPTTIHNNLDRWMEMASSFEKEAGSPKEIVVVDDGSAAPVALDSLRSPVRLLRNERSRGFGAAADQALREVRTPYALLVDADITFLPGDFASAYQAFKTQASLAWSNFQQVTQEGDFGSSVELVLPPPWIYGLGNQVSQRWALWKGKAIDPPALGERLMAVPVAHSSSTLVRMEAFHKIDGFDTRFWQCQSDNDICLRLARAGWKVGVDRIYTVRHDGVGGRTGGRNRVYDLYRGKLLLYEKHRPASRFYLRPLLAARHALEAIAASLFLLPATEHHQASFRWQLALGALRGYPAAHG